jgi:hypothetical protein
MKLTERERQLRALREQRWRELHDAAKPVSNAVHVSNEMDVSNSAASNSDAVSVSNEPSRLVRWRVANRERYNSYMRGYMQRRRSLTASSSAG